MMGYNFSAYSTYKFFKGIQTTLNRFAEKKKTKYKDVDIAAIKLDYYIQYAYTIFQVYNENNKDFIELFDSMYGSFENCLKTQPDKFKTYTEKCPVILHFLAAYISCNDDKDIKPFLSAL